MLWIQLEVVMPNKLRNKLIYLKETDVLPYASSSPLTKLFSLYQHASQTNSGGFIEGQDYNKKRFNIQ